MLEPTVEEKESITKSEAFTEFVGRAAGFLERALHAGVDVAKDFASEDADSGATDGQVKQLCDLFDEKNCKNRSITSIDWSPKVQT